MCTICGAIPVCIYMSTKILVLSIVGLKLKKYVVCAALSNLPLTFTGGFLIPHIASELITIAREESRRITILKR